MMPIVWMTCWGCHCTVAANSGHGWIILLMRPPVEARPFTPSATYAFCSQRCLLAYASTERLGDDPNARHGLPPPGSPR